MGFWGILDCWTLAAVFISSPVPQLGQSSLRKRTLRTGLRAWFWGQTWYFHGHSHGLPWVGILWEQGKGLWILDLGSPEFKSWLCHILLWELGEGTEGSFPIHILGITTVFISSGGREDESLVGWLKSYSVGLVGGRCTVQIPQPPKCT
jgi:hypothetical protein